jgi:hypothetical protein
VVHPRGQARADVQEAELPGESVGVGYASLVGEGGEQGPHPARVRFGGMLHGTARRGLGTGHHERAPGERGIGELLAVGVEDAEQPFAGARKRVSARLVRSLVPAGRPSR